MALVMALQQGWDPESIEFKGIPHAISRLQVFTNSLTLRNFIAVNNDIHGLIASVNDGSTSA